MCQTAAVVVTYNRKKLLTECVEALLSQSVSCDLLIVDNASTDGTKEYLASLLNQSLRGGKPALHVFRMENNLGGAGGFSYGIKKGVDLGYEYLWVMDDDCIPRNDALENLLHSAMQHQEGWGFLASKIVNTDGSLCKINMPMKGVFYKRNYPYKAEYQCDFACFTSVLFPAKVIKNVGLPISDFFIWSDDWEYTRRISRRFPCFGVMNSIAVHKTTNRKSCDIVFESGDRLNRYPYIYRNDVFLYKREGLLGVFYLFARVFLHIGKVILKSPNQKIEKCKIICMNTYKGFFFKPNLPKYEVKEFDL